MRSHILIASFAAMSALLFSTCKPDEANKLDIGAAPTAAFTVTQGSDANHYHIVCTTSGAFMAKWDLGNGATADTLVTDAYYPFKGTYTITLTAFNKGGYGTTSQTVTVATTDPNACQGNFAILTGCGTKTWKLDPNPKALHVGPDATQVYWESDASTIAARPCLWDDEYTFNADGSFLHDDKGTIFIDDDGQGHVVPAGINLSGGCHATSELQGIYKGWSNFPAGTFSVTPSRLTITQAGAFVALYKVGTNADVIAPPASVSYTVLSCTPTKLVIAAVYSTLTWKFTLVPK